MDNLEKLLSPIYLDANRTFESKMPSLIAAAFLYACPNEELHTIIEKHIRNVEYSMQWPIDASDMDIGVKDIFLVTDFNNSEYAYYWNRPSSTAYTMFPRHKYRLTYTIYCATCDIYFYGTESNTESECNIIRLSMFLYLLNGSNCCDGFAHYCPIWFYDPYNLPAVLMVFDEDIKRNYTEVLKAYLENMDKYGIELRDIVEACQEHGYMELLMQVMRILGEKPKEQEQLRL